MRGLLFFRVESAGQPFDEELRALLARDQENHRAAYHIENICVRIGAAEDSLSLGPETVWCVRTGAMGEIASVQTHMDYAQQLSTYLYGRIVKNDDSGCAAIFVSNGTAPAGTAAVQLSLIVSMRLCNLYPVRVHIFLLQDQFVHHDPAVARLMRQIGMSNAVRPIFYTAQYLLPWEDTDGARACSRQTVAALVKTMMMAKADPMMLKGVGQPRWVETAAIRRLESPVERITNVVFQYLSRKFDESVLSPAVDQPSAAAIPPKEARDCVRRLEGFVSEIERATLLPTVEDLMCIMPLKNPPAGAKPDDHISVDRAWDAIYSLYGHERGAELQKRLNPSLEELESQYRAFGASLAAELLRQVFQLARSSGQEFATLPHLVSQIGENLTRKRERPQAEESEPLTYDRGLLLSRERREAVSMARMRHFYLTTVHRAATQRLANRRQELRAQVMQDAVNQARQFIKNCMFRLDAEYQRRCSIYLNRQVETNCYDTDLNAAYEYWCSHEPAVEPVTARELYELVTEDVFRMQPEEGARKVCEGLVEQLHQRTRAAVDSIRVNIDSFFPELAFRAGLLAGQGCHTDLYASLLAYLSGQTTHSPLLYQDKAGSIISIQARALIFHVANADEFVSLAQRAGVEVVNDPYEKGVQLVVKYAGNALDDVLVVRGNAPAQA